MVTSIAADTIGCRKAYQGRKKTTPWWTDEVKNVVKEKMRCFRRWMKRRIHEDRLAYELTRNDAEKEKR